jgi:endonuclease III
MLDSTCSRLRSRKSLTHQNSTTAGLVAGLHMVTRRPSLALQKRILDIILQQFPVRNRVNSSSAFEILIWTVLSQNTNDVNSGRAMERLKKQFDITPEVLSRAPINDLIEAIHSAGLYRVKAPRIKQISSIIMNQFEGDLDSVLNRSPVEARSILTEMPGVGYKTADVVLAFAKGYPTIPVDTHVARVSKRLGIARGNAKYEEIRLALERLVLPNRRVRMHLSLIRFGREICRAPTPLCPQCPVNRACPSSSIRRRTANSMI